MDCPVCKVSLGISLTPDQELLYDCPSCQSSLYFEKGEVQILKKNNPSSKTQEESEESLTPEVEESSAEEVEKREELPPEVPSLDFKAEELSEGSDEEVSNEEIKDKKLPEEEPTPFEPEEPPEESPKEDTSQLVDFASDSKARDEGLFFYDLRISEIDSNNLKEEIETILQDENLKLNFEEQDTTINEGILQLKKISPIKVHIIVKSLIGLPLRITWKQHLTTDVT